MASGDLILMGPPGSGKGTQAQRLAKTPGWVHISTGELFRENLSQGTALGRVAEGYVSKGAYVPDDVTVGMVRERLRTVPSSSRIVFDGFPRTLTQAEALDALLRENDRRIADVLVLDCARDELIRRLTQRGQGRVDDSREVIDKRFDVYDEQTRPVVEHYERRGIVKRVEGIGGVDEIAERLMAVIT